MTPPATCDSQASLLMIRPQSCTATMCVQRTTPVSVSTSTSAICTPPTWPLEMFSLPGSLEMAQAPVAVALGLVHAEPGADLLPGPLLLVLRVDDLARLDRQVLRVGPELAARPSRTGRRGPPAPRAAPPGPATGRWCCRRSRSSGRTGSRRSSTTMSVGSRPRTSATTMAVTVRWAVPRSCVEVSAVTRAVAADDDGALVGLRRRRRRPRCAGPCRCRA